MGEFGTWQFIEAENQKIDLIATIYKYLVECKI